MKLVILMLVLLVAVPAYADCPSDLAATAEYGSVLREQQDRQQREIAILRAKLAAIEKENDKKAAEKPKPEEKKK